MKRSIVLITAIFVISGLLFGEQSINLKLGLFTPSQDSDLWEQNRRELIFDKNDMQATYFALEFERYLNRGFSLSIEGAHYRKEHYTQFRDFVFENGDPIFHNISLEITSLEVGFKVYPMGHRRVFCPFLGAAFGIYYWHYVQWGDFLEQEGDDIYIYEDENAQTETYTPGFNINGGFVYRFKRQIGISFSAKYLMVKGELSSFYQGFERFDLGGLVFSIGLNIYFR
jgi:hypothetical protein